jgi:hypothetical protein
VAPMVLPSEAESEDAVHGIHHLDPHIRTHVRSISIAFKATRLGFYFREAIKTHARLSRLFNFITMNLSTNL